MLYLAAFLLGIVFAVLLIWVWEFMTGPSHAPLVRAIDEHRAAKENEELMRQFLHDDLPPLNRAEIWVRMGWIWRETRGWVVASGRLLGFLVLALFALLYAFLWFKTLVWPSSDDLRLLLGGRSLLLYVVQNEKTSSR